MNYELILKALPASWAELKLKDYIKLTNLAEPSFEDEDEQLAAKIDLSLQIMSLLTGLSIDEVRQMPKVMFHKMAAKVKFLDTAPLPLNKPKYKWKTVEEVTYDEYSAYNLLQKHFFQAMPTIIRAFLKDEMTEEAILEMSMDEVHTGFFLLKRSVRKFLADTRKSLEAKLKKDRKQATN